MWHIRSVSLNHYNVTAIAGLPPYDGVLYGGVLYGGVLSAAVL